MARKKGKVVELPEKATVQNAKSIWASILEVLKKSDEILLDFSNVEEVDVSLFQILIAIKKVPDKLVDVEFSGIISSKVLEAAIVGGFVAEETDAQSFLDSFYEYL